MANGNSLQFDFVDVNGTSEHFQLVKEQFEEVILPIYGSQVRALNDIESSTDRKCLLMLANQKPVGILVFKTEITEAREGSKYPAGCFVIKTLFVINSTDHKGIGYGSRLMDQAVKEARGRNATSMYLTVSDSADPEALKFFQKKGFVIERELEDKFTQGVTEYVLTKSLQ